MSQGTHGRAERSPSINRETKVFNDPIHGHIELDHIFMNVIDTPEFQRLRNLKQLGAVNFVYPGAVHTRFEHSIGTCYLALRLVRHLREAQPYLGITNEEEICVALAGLCHDLGHGPFSHTFDKILIPQSKHEGYENWSHELGSIKIFDSMVERYDLIEVFRGYGYHLTTEDIHFVKEMIYGPLDVDNPEYKEPDDGEYQAKDPDKHFLYEIISNKTNEIDVDKWDYFARDSYHLGVRFTFQHDRFIKFSKVLNVSEKGPRKTQICFRDKEAINVYQMFHTRFTLYRMACYHPITVGMEAMITDALLAAAKHLTFTKRNGSTFKLQDAISDMDAYQQLDDNILTLILHSNVDNLKEARQILERVRKRDIYKCVDRIPVKEDKDPEQEDTIREDIVQCEANEGLLKADDLLVQIIKIDYGMKDKNPVDCVLFFSKEDPDKPKPIRQDEVSHLLPKTFQELQVFIFVKKASKRYRDRAKKCVAEWRKKTSWVQQKVGTDIPTVKSMSEGSESSIRETKVFQDPIHGSIELDPVYMKIIDTPEFQRLRNLKHLGAVNFVYPGAIHTRFEHSIGYVINALSHKQRKMTTSGLVKMQGYKCHLFSKS